jgi:hypothetical protein
MKEVTGCKTRSIFTARMERLERTRLYSNLEIPHAPELTRYWRSIATQPPRPILAFLRETLPHCDKRFIHKRLAPLSPPRP